MRLCIFIFSFLFITTNVSYSTNIIVLDVEYIINNSNQYINLVERISNYQIEYKNTFDQNEKTLLKKKEDIESKKIILNNEEITREIDEYKIMLNNFQNKVSLFNTHFNNQLNLNKNIILKEILKMLEIYANENKIDLIFDSKNYILASNNLNITNKILESVNNLNLKLNFEPFEID